MEAMSAPSLEFTTMYTAMNNNFLSLRTSNYDYAFIFFGEIL